MAATGQEMVRENEISSSSGKSQGISLRVREIFNSLKEVRKKGNFKSIFVHFTDMNW